MATTVSVEDCIELSETPDKDSAENKVSCVQIPDSTLTDTVQNFPTDTPAPTVHSGGQNGKIPNGNPKNGHVNKGYSIEIDYSDSPEVKGHKKVERSSKTGRLDRYLPWMKAAAPYFLWLFYCLAGASVFYLIEKNMLEERDSRTTNGTCIGETSYSGALFYVLSACSTLGFGELYPCTVPSKVLTVFYILVGIPLTLLVLAKVGKWMCTKIGHGYRYYLNAKSRITKRFRRNSARRGSATLASQENIVISSTGLQIKVEDGTLRKIDQNEVFEHPEEYEEQLDQDELPDIPIWIGLFFSLIFVVIGSVYYWAVEGYKQGESFYYSFLTFLTGDLQVSKFELSIPMFFCLFMGFSMVSTTVSMIVNNINNLVNKTKRAVRREMSVRKRRIAQGIPTEKLETEQQILERVLKANGSSWLVSLVSEADSKQLLQVVKTEVHKAQSLSQNSIGCQTMYRLPESIRSKDAWTQDYPPPTENQGTTTFEPEYSDILVQATPMVRDHQAQVRYVPRTASKGIDNTVEMVEKGVTSYPDTKSVMTQHPKMSRLKQIVEQEKIDEISKKEPVKQERPVRLSTR